MKFRSYVDTLIKRLPNDRHALARKNTLRAVVSHMNHARQAAWPSGKTIAQHAGCKPRCVSNCLRYWRDVGVLVTDHCTGGRLRGGRGRTTRYRLNLAALIALADPQHLLPFTEWIPTNHARSAHEYTNPSYSCPSDRKKAPAARSSPPANFFRRMRGVVWKVIQTCTPQEWWSEAKALCQAQHLPYWQRSPSGGSLLDAAFRAVGPWAKTHGYSV
jgi:hypothetical protein